MEANRPVSREDWLKERRELMTLEKAHMRQGDELAARRRALPWVRMEKDYVFHGPAGPLGLADMFAGRSQLIVHHLMFHPDWEAACPGCSFQADHIDGPRQHLEHHDVGIVAVSRAPFAKLAAYSERMGWRFPWFSSYGSDFNLDFQVSFAKEHIAKGRIDYNFSTITADPRYLSEELPGISVFCRDEAGRVFHTYSTFARGLDALLGGSHYLDLTPKGRNEAEDPNWERRHDEYGAASGGCARSKG